MKPWPHPAAQGSVRCKPAHPGPTPSHAGPALPYIPPRAGWLLAFLPFSKREQISLSTQEWGRHWDMAGLPQLGPCQPSTPCQAAALPPMGEAPAPAALAPPPTAFPRTGRFHAKSSSCLALFLSSHCLSSPPALTASRLLGPFPKHHACPSLG